MSFNENSRVKLPALVHLCKLGYNYVSEKKLTPFCDRDTNINAGVFKSKLHQFNPLLKPIEIDQFFEKLKIVLDNDDLGREFYNILSANSGIKLIDFEHIENNDFECTVSIPPATGSISLHKFRSTQMPFVSMMDLRFDKILFDRLPVPR